jgi:hypothetical protein
VIAEDAAQVTFEFYSPYIIAATPPNDTPWGVYEQGCRNGLVLHGRARCKVSLSTDQGATWQDCGPFADGMDLTDRVKGGRQYWLRLHASARTLAGSRLILVTVCQANAAVLPRLRDGGSQVRFATSGRAVVSAGPNLPQAQAHLVEGRFGSPQATLEISTPRKEKALAVHAAAHIHSGSPSSPDVTYGIDYSTDTGRTWKPLVEGWTIPRRGEEPADFWSQSLCWGSIDLGDPAACAVRVRFRNSGNKDYARCEAHVVYRAGRDDTQVTFAWADDAGTHRSMHCFTAGANSRPEPPEWRLPTGRNVRTLWVEMEPVVVRAGKTG